VPAVSTTMASKLSSVTTRFIGGTLAARLVHWATMRARVPAARVLFPSVYPNAYVKFIW
jgi:hypothetical protein